MTRSPGRSGRLATTVVALTAAALGALPAAAGARPIGAYTTKGAWTFVSAPNVHPPKLLTHGSIDYRALAPGDFLLADFPNVNANRPMIGQSGPLVLDNHLQPVWFQPVPTDVIAADLEQETYLGSPVLVWWQGVVTNTGSTANGEIVVVDQHYRRIATLKARAPWVISLHDASITGGAVWVTVYRAVRNQNLAAYGGSGRGTVYDAGVQEYELKTGKLLDTWDALNPGGVANVPLSQSEQPPPAAASTAWDAYHLNSVESLPGNQLLVSMRNTWAAYLIDEGTGKIVWTLGGKRSSFRFATNSRFAWQHDVQLVGGDEVTVFNDNCCQLLPGRRLGAPSGPSQGMVLRLDLARHTVKRVASYLHSPSVDTALLGSMQLLPGGNTLIDWGSQTYLSEYSGHGRQLLDAQWPVPDQSYRARFTSKWFGMPHFPPSAAMSTPHGRTTVYASWNGATEVVRWQVLAGHTATRLAPVATKRRTGFETAITLPKGSYQVFMVRALNAAGIVIGSSKPLR